MKTITKSIFSFSELSEEAKQKALEDYTSDPDYEMHWNGEWRETLDVFCGIFPVTWEEYDYDQKWISYSIDRDRVTDDELDLSGARLMAYIWNKFRDIMFQGKYRSLSDRPEAIRHRRVKAKWSEHREVYYHSWRSAIMIDREPDMTGFCGDYDILDPLYSFLDKCPEGITYADLLRECMESWAQAIHADYEGQCTVEYLEDHAEANGYEYTEEGERWHG